MKLGLSYEDKKYLELLKTIKRYKGLETALAAYYAWLEADDVPQSVRKARNRAFEAVFGRVVGYLA